MSTVAGAQQQSDYDKLRRIPYLYAFNILNIGRFKLGAGCTGGAKVALRAACEYAKERAAFGKKIADFGLIQAKIGESIARIFAAESMVYRTAGMIDANLNGAHDNATALKRIEEYDAECSMVKVFGSEALDYVVDDDCGLLRRTILVVGHGAHGNPPSMLITVGGTSVGLARP